MKREIWFGLILVVFLAAAGGFFARVAPKMSAAREDLGWLRTNFELSRPQMEQIEELHRAYTPYCEEMCSRVREANARVRQLIESGPGNEADLEAALKEAEEVETECRLRTATHVYNVARVMPTSEAKRFLAEMAPQLVDAPAGIPKASK